MASNPCPFCGEQLEELLTETSGIYSHYNSGNEQITCEVQIFFPRGERVRERFERREGTAEDVCPFCGGSVELAKTSEGDTLVKCTNCECEATVNFGKLAFLTRDRQPKYTVEETTDLFRKRL